MVTPTAKIIKIAAVLVAIGTGFERNLIPVIAILGPLYFLGTMLGSRLNRRAPEALVRRVVLTLVVLIAAVGLAL